MAKWREAESPVEALIGELLDVAAPNWPDPNAQAMRRMVESMLPELARRTVELLVSKRVTDGWSAIWLALTDDERRTILRDAQRSVEEPE